MPKKGGTSKMDHIEPLVIECTYPHSFGARLVEIAGGLCLPDPLNGLAVIWTNDLSRVKIIPGGESHPDALILKVADIKQIERFVTNVPVKRSFRKTETGEVIIDGVTLEIGKTNYQIRLEQV